MYNPKPVYNKDNEAYPKQMYEWHLQMAEQLKSFHLDKAYYFRKMINKTTIDVVMGNGTT
ncbi:hypothetical protein [Paenibacillus agricola]|uniref:Uncharacterized protein n=1 Tax=Paenibacillus agricola TaxID=2716264 RepID=A0ABX0JEN1_9BACL|nr:hypothetical protein [Paenibacillus agricola]NHN35002.1 hypothetical protein [Paenibacillus agricola]